MDKLRLVSLLLVLSGCAPKISEHFEQNTYVRNFNIHIINDSLQLYFKTPADISYTTSKKDLRKRIRNAKIKPLGQVLVHGIADDPLYEYFVTLPQQNTADKPKELLVLDTVIHGQPIRFTGKPLAQNSGRALESDLKKMFRSLELGPTYRKQITTVLDIVDKYQASNQFYAALLEISGFPTYDKEEDWAKMQMELTFSSFLGKNDTYEALLASLESRYKPNNSILEILRQESAIHLDVIDTLVSKAKQHKVVMVNENHFYPNHRILVSDLLPKLKEIGYDYLALEDLNEKQDSVLNLASSYPTLKTGFYTSEQNYANLIRKAKELGFEFVAYDYTGKNNDREIDQAENLYNKTFKIDPESKVLVLAGIDHILEKPTDMGKEWMACIFKKRYDIDPLTVSQTHLNSYRDQIESGYGIINSDFFTNDRLTSVDYLVLNNTPIQAAASFPGSYRYKNDTPNDVQVALFYGNEIDNPYDHMNKIPYFTTILPSGKKYDLPINEDQEIHLFTFDKTGKQIDRQIITPSAKGDK